MKKFAIILISFFLTSSIALAQGTSCQGFEKVKSFTIKTPDDYSSETYLGTFSKNPPPYLCLADTLLKHLTPNNLKPSTKYKVEIYKLKRGCVQQDYYEFLKEIGSIFPGGSGLALILEEKPKSLPNEWTLSPDSENLFFNFNQHGVDSVTVAGGYWRKITDPNETGCAAALRLKKDNYFELNVNSTRLNPTETAWVDIHVLAFFEK